DYRGVEPVGRGPIVISIDESGSMQEQDKIYLAKALALSMLWIARHQKRWCYLIGWSSADQRRNLVIPIGTHDDLALLEWLTQFFNGGTVPPLDDMPTLFKTSGAPTGKTDIILIT